MKMIPLAAILVACQAAAQLHQANIFEAGQGGYAHYRVPAIAVSSRGTVMAFAEARKNTRGDWGTQDIMLRRSRDRAVTWDAPRIIARLDQPGPKNPVALAQKLGVEGEVTYNNVVPIVDGGTLHVLFCVEYARCYWMQSSDDGETFSRPVDITPVFEKFRKEYDWKVIATGPGHGIKLKNGRLLVPVWLSDGTGGHAHRPSIVSVIYSGTQGKSWQRGDVVVRHPELKNPSETVAVQLSGGRVMLNIRNESPEHRRAISTSADGATAWSKPVFHPELVEPICMGSILGLGSGRIVFANPDSNEPRDAARPEGNFKRQNVSVKLSNDDGKTWPVKRVLEPGISGYTDLAAGPDGSMYCIYERGSPSGVNTTIRYLTVARFNLQWLMSRVD